MAAHRDPLEDERERARRTADGTPPEVDREEAGGDVPSTPSLGAPPRRDKSRPVFRSSQLQEGEEDPERRLRG